MQRGKKIDDLLREKSESMIDPAGREVSILKDEAAHAICDQYGLSMHDLYIRALEAEICPYRYLRNREIISAQEQLKLAISTAAVVGAGGLGGQILLLIARLGVGRLISVDRDVFDETNLNRQALSSIPAIGKSKSKEAADVIASINPGVQVEHHFKELDLTNFEELLKGTQVIADALDNVPDRLNLEKAAKKLGVPLVHGAIAGFEGQVMTVFPEDAGLSCIYRDARTKKKDPRSPEAILGVPALTPNIIAGFQAMEIIKILLGRGKPFRNSMLYLDLENGRFNHFSFEEEKSENRS